MTRAGGPAARVDDVAAALGCSPRRLRQLREAGQLVPVGRGLVDQVHARWAFTGLRVLRQRSAPDVDRYTAAAAGFLLSHWAEGIAAPQIAAWATAAARWGLGEDAAGVALMRAAQLLGDACPRIDVKLEVARCSS